MKKIILIDNYDSFTFNLYHYLSSLKVNVDVIRNDKITANEILKRNYHKIVISPGPGEMTILSYFFFKISLDVILSFLITSTFAFKDDR